MFGVLLHPTGLRRRQPLPPQSARFREAPIIQGILNAAKQAAKTDAGKKVHQTTKQVKDKISDAQEEVLEVWETSQNPWVYRLSSIYDGLFGETPMGVAIKEIRRAEPDFILEKWKKNMKNQKSKNDLD